MPSEPQCRGLWRSGPCREPVAAVVGPVDRNPRHPSPHRADHPPQPSAAAVRRRGTSRAGRGRRRRRGRTARVGAERGADGLQRLGDVEGAGVDVDRHPGGARRRGRASASSPSETSIIAVAPACGGRRSRRRTAAPGAGRPRPARAASGSRAPSTASPPAAQPWRPRDARRTSPGCGAGRGAPAPAVARAEHGHRDHDLVRRGSGRRRRREAPTRAHSSAIPSREVERPLRPAGRPGPPSPTVSECAAAAHRVDVGEVRGRGPVADRRSAEAQSRRKCRPSTSRSVDDHDVPVADAQHGRVVTGADEHCSPCANSGGERGDQAELAHVGERGVGAGTIMAPIRTRSLGQPPCGPPVSRGARTR